MFYSVFDLSFQKWFFQFIKNSNQITLSKMFSKFMNPDKSLNWPKEYLKFVEDFKLAAKGELYDTREELVAGLKKIYEENGNDVGKTTRINIDYGARLIYEEQKWIKEVFLKHLKDICGENLSEENLNIASSLIELGSLERINFSEIDKNNKELSLSYDILEWKRNKFKQPIHNYRTEKQTIKFLMDERRSLQIKSLLESSSNKVDSDFYTVALDMVKPRANLLHVLSL